VRELPHIMHEILRVLKPGGVCIFLTPDWESNMKQFYQIFTHVNPYTMQSLEQCLNMYGFEKVRSEHLIQLPQVWNSSFLNMMARATSYLPITRSSGSWVRWSKEQMLIGIGYCPK